MATEADDLTQAKDPATARARLRKTILLAAAADVGLALLVLLFGGTLLAGVLVLIALIGTPLLLWGLDRYWQQQGHETR